MKTSSIELLEARIAPAAVALALTGSSLKVTFSSHDNIGIAADPAGGIDVFGSPGDTFTLNGSPLSTISNEPGVSLSTHHIGAVSIADTNSADQNDIVTLVAPIQGNASISLAGTGNTVNIDSSIIHGAVSVKTPAGGTQVTFGQFETQQLLGGSVKLALGPGNNTVSVLVPQFEVNGAFMVSGGPTKGPLTTINSNQFTANLNQGEGSYFRIEGEFLFNSPLASANFLLRADSVQIAGKMILNEGQAVSTSVMDGVFSDFLTTIGGNFSLHTSGTQQFWLDAPQLDVGGSLSVAEGGAGSVTIQVEGSMSMSGLALSGQAGATLQIGAVGNGPNDPETSIGGNVKISGFGTVNVGAFGSVGGNFAVSGVETLSIDSGVSGPSGPAVAHLAIGGSLSISAVTPPTTQAAVAPLGFTPPLSAYVADVLVGGSLTVTGNSSGTQFNLADSSIVGNLNLNLGAKVNGPGQFVTITETANDHTMFIGGALNASLGASGSFTVTDLNSTQDILVYGQATFTEPSVHTVTISTQPNNFALPVKVKTAS